MNITGHCFSTKLNLCKKTLWSPFTTHQQVHIRHYETGYMTDESRISVISHLFLWQHEHWKSRTGRGQTNKPDPTEDVCAMFFCFWCYTLWADKLLSIYILWTAQTPKTLLHGNSTWSWEVYTKKKLFLTLLSQSVCLCPCYIQSHPHCSRSVPVRSVIRLARLQQSQSWTCKKKIQ
jgi:hypothetical protein